MMVVPLPAGNERGVDMPRTEYMVLGVLLVLGLLAFPAFRDVALIERVALAICSGLGII